MSCVIRNGETFNKPFVTESTVKWSLHQLHVTISLHDGHLLWCYRLHRKVHCISWRLCHWRRDELLELEEFQSRLNIFHFRSLKANLPEG